MLRKQSQSSPTKFASKPFLSPNTLITMTTHIRGYKLIHEVVMSKPESERVETKSKLTKFEPHRLLDTAAMNFN